MCIDRGMGIVELKQLIDEKEYSLKVSKEKLKQLVPDMMLVKKKAKEIEYFFKENGLNIRCIGNPKGIDMITDFSVIIRYKLKESKFYAVYNKGEYALDDENYAKFITHYNKMIPVLNNIEEFGISSIINFFEHKQREIDNLVNFITKIEAELEDIHYHAYGEIMYNDMIKRVKEIHPNKDRFPLGTKLLGEDLELIIKYARMYDNLGMCYNFSAKKSNGELPSRLASGFKKTLDELYYLIGKYKLKMM